MAALYVIERLAASLRQNSFQVATNPEVTLNRGVDEFLPKLDFTEVM
jgi:hypothetical protein